MRFLKTLISILLFLVLGVLALFFGGREALLAWGVSSFKSSLTDLQRASRTSYSSQCAEQIQGGPALESTVQLRFISDTEFVIEAQCDQFTESPILISKGELTSFMTKTAGGPGIVWGPTRSSVELVIFEDLNEQVKELFNLKTDFILRRKIVGVENSVATVLPADTELGIGPITSCAGYGFKCCKVEEEVGVGERITGAPDCDQNCYTTCSGRPIILAFNTNPLYDIQSRTLTMSTGASVEFRYVATGESPEDLRGIIDFGDGQKSSFMAGESGSAVHKYTCMTGNCSYKAQLKVQDSWGIESFDSSVAHVIIQVQ